MIVRRCERRDLARVEEIEKASFPDPYPRTFFEWLLLRTGDGFMVAARDEVVGYVVCGITLTRKGHLISIATSPDARRCGVGTQLIESALGYLSGKHVDDVTLEVRKSNRAAIAFYQRFSFVESGRKPHYYHDGEDALVMRRRPGLPPRSGLDH